MTRLRSHTLTFLLLASFAFVLIVLDQDSRLERPQDLAQRLTIPVEEWFSEATQRVGGYFTSFRRVGVLEAENERLRRQIDELSLVNVQVVELQKENERLRDLLDFSQQNPNYTMQVAEVVAQESPARIVGVDVSNFVRAVRINQGREVGVEPGMSVITARGLVGLVIESGDGWAKVLLVTDETSHITATVQQGRASGVVEGTGDGLVMRYIPHEQRVEPGDVVLTAGLGGEFPKGLVVGVVESVNRNDVQPWQEATIRSTIEFAQLESVFVVRSFRATLEAEAETP
jgi:rod shape-determining protein MreC